MATKKISLGLDADDFKIENVLERSPEPITLTTTVPMGQITTGLNINDFAVAALKSLDWNQIGMGVDQAAKLCWQMAEAMMRNKP